MVTWEQYIDSNYEDVREAIIAMGYSLDPLLPKTHARAKRGNYYEGKFGERLTTPEQKQAAENDRADEYLRHTKIKLTELHDMCWQYGLSLAELLDTLVVLCLPIRGGWKRKAQRLALSARKGENVRPGLGFRLTQLVNPACWNAARGRAFALGRRSTPKQLAEWAQAQRMRAIIDAVRGYGPLPRSPMDDPPGDLETYLRATDKTRRELNDILRRGIMPYRVLPRRTKT